jgi:hypothetical protein|tara:strand:+ start:553 stop:717 length:165 start_codon:yes stop_codon:yes gene_type:complete
MSFLLHSRQSRKKVEKMIKEHVDQMRKSYSWDGEHKEVTKRIFNFLRFGEMENN